MTDPVPSPIRHHLEAVAEYMGSRDANAGEHKRGVIDLLRDLEEAARRCSETGARFTLIAISAPDLPAIEGARKCVLWAQKAAGKK